MTTNLQAAGPDFDYDDVVRICDAHGIGLPVDDIEMVVEIVKHARIAVAPASEGAASFALRALVAAGHVTQAKVNEALALASNVGLSGSEASKRDVPDLVEFCELIDDYQIEQLDGNDKTRTSARIALMEAYRAALATDAARPTAERAALEKIANWPDGGNSYGQENIRRFARAQIASTDAAKGEAKSLTYDQRAQIEEAICSLEHAGFKHEPANLRALLAAPEVTADDARDAKRYRFIREGGYENADNDLPYAAVSDIDSWGKPRASVIESTALDAAIDAALAAQNGEKS